jgi:hypothetical protein
MNINTLDIFSKQLNLAHSSSIHSFETYLVTLFSHSFLLTVANMRGIIGSAILATLMGTPTWASPVSKREALLGVNLPVSLPPLIPSIPGVTEPLAANAPPLPILQLPTPPLASPPFTASNIKPKKIGYFWTGAGDNIHADFLVTTSLDDVSSV